MVSVVTVQVGSGTLHDMECYYGLSPIMDWPWVAKEFRHRQLAELKLH